MNQIFTCVLIGVYTAVEVWAAGAGPLDGVTGDVRSAVNKTITAVVGNDDVSPEYVLGTGDRLTVFVPDLDELGDKTYRVNGEGDVTLPLAGHIHAAGLTVTALEKQVALHLATVIKDPNVVITIAEFRSHSVSVLGAVDKPGVHQIEDGKRLFEVISLAGGLRPDAGNTINITRDRKWGEIPLPGVKDDVTGRFSVASVGVKSILNATDPSSNIPILPGDVISVSKAEVVYVVGSIVKPGGYPVGQNDRLSVLQVLSLAEGLQRTAAPSQAMVLRTVPGAAERQRIAINIKQLISGKGNDMPLQPDDILFVPDSKSKTVTMRTMDTMINLATGMAIYGRF
jgi:polysaccharide export outer membrane protein